MKRLRILSDVATSRGIVHAGPDVVLLDDAEADSCIRHGLAELADEEMPEAAPPPKPVMPPNVLERGSDPPGKPVKSKKKGS